MNQSQLSQQRQSVLALKVPPLAIFTIFAGLMWIAARATGPALDASIPAKGATLVVLAMIGSVICIAGVVSFRRAKTTVNPMKPQTASSLIVSGIYRYTRNPMYLGLLLVLLGWAIFLSNLAALAFLPVFIIYMNRFQIEPEERVLTSLFPREYPAYQSRVRRWI